MSTVKKVVGKIPVGRGAYSASNRYYKENTVTLYGMSFRALYDMEVGFAPATINSAGSVILTNTDKWQLLSGTPEAYQQTSDIQNLNANTGISEYPIFDPAKDYVVGDVVKYEGRLYRFVFDKAFGEWNPNMAENVDNQIYVDNTILDGFGYIFDEQIEFTKQWQWHKLVKPIKKGQKIVIKGYTNRLNFYSEYTNVAGTNIDITSGMIAPIDLYWVRSLDTIGVCRVSVESLKNDYFNIRVTQSLSKNLLDAGCANIDKYSNSHYLLELPYIIKRDKDESKITISKRNAGYNMVTVFLDKNRFKIATMSPSFGETIDIPSNCEYIQFADYIAEMKIGKSMVNYGDKVLEYEPFVDICNIGLYNQIEANKQDILTNKNNIAKEAERIKEAENNILISFEETLDFSSQYKGIKLSHPIKAGQIIEINGLSTLNAYGIDGYNVANMNLTIHSGEVAPFDIYYLRNLDKVGVATILVTKGVDIINHSNSNNLLMPYMPNKKMLESLSGTNSVTIPNLVVRDKAQTKLTMSVRQSAYNFIVGFVDKDMKLILSPSVITLGATISIPENCEYIFFRDYIDVIKKNIKTMINYGEEVKEYEPYVGIDNLSFANKIKEIEDEIIRVEDKINEAISKEGLNVELVVDEPLVLSATRDNNLVYVKDMFKNLKDERISLYNTHYKYAGGIGWAKMPTIGIKEGYIMVANEQKATPFWNYKTKSVGVPAVSSVNILDIGSSYIDIGQISNRQKLNFERDGISVNQLGTMGTKDSRHEARSGGTWDFLVKPLGRAVILDVSGVTSLPTTGYPGSTYKDENGVKWTVRGVIIDNGSGKLVLSSFAVDTNYGSPDGVSTTDYDLAANNMPLSGTITKTSNDSTGTTTSAGDETIQYTSKELVYYNPFWNPLTNELDFSYYIRKWNFANPDIITLTFGGNDLGGGTLRDDDFVDGVVDKAVEVVNKIHEQLPNCKIMITTSCYGYDGGSANESQVPVRAYNLKKYYKILVERLGVKTTYSNYVRVVPTLCMVDRINGFNVAEETPCSLYSDTIKVAGDMIHPNYNGFFQFADAMLGYEYELLGL